MKPNNDKPQRQRRRALPSLAVISMLIALLIGSTQAQISPVELCSCNPRVYKLTFDFDLECEPINIDLEGEGIVDATCLVSGFENINVTDLVPVAVSSVQLIEIGQDGTVLAMDQRTGDFRDGSSFNYTAVSFVGAVAPRAFQLRALGINEAEEPIVLQWSVTYTNNCGVWPVLEINDSIGWTIFNGLAAPIELVCPERITPSPTPPPTLTATPNLTVTVPPPTDPPTPPPTPSPTPPPTPGATPNISVTVPPPPSDSIEEMMPPPSESIEEFTSIDPDLGLTEPQLDSLEQEEEPIPEPELASIEEPTAPELDSLEEEHLMEPPLASASVEEPTVPKLDSLEEEHTTEPPVTSMDDHPAVNQPEPDSLDYVSLPIAEPVVDSVDEEAYVYSEDEEAYAEPEHLSVDEGNWSKISKSKAESKSKSSKASKPKKGSSSKSSKASSPKSKSKSQSPSSKSKATASKSKASASKESKGKGGKGSSNKTSKGNSASSSKGDKGSKGKGGKGGKGSSNKSGNGNSASSNKGSKGSGSKGKGTSLEDDTTSMGPSSKQGTTSEASSIKSTSKTLRKRNPDIVEERVYIDKTRYYTLRRGRHSVIKGYEGHAENEQT